MKKSITKNTILTTIDKRLNTLLTSQQKLWELIFKLDKDILSLEEVTAKLLLEYKSIREFEHKFLKNHNKNIGQPKPKYPY